MVSDPGLGKVEGETVLQDRDSSPHQLLRVTGRTGPVEVTATTGDSSSHSDTAKLQLVQDAVLAPSAMELFVLESGDSKASQGSGYFTVLSESEAVTAGYSSVNSSLSVTPLTTGKAELQLVDLCLSARTRARLEVAVAGVDRVILDTEHKVQLGQTIIVTVVGGSC